MNAPDSPPLSTEEYQDLLLAQDWETLQEDLVTLTSRLLRGAPMEQAEELAARAIARVFEPKYQRWDPARYPKILSFLGHVVFGLIANERRKKRRRPEVLYDHDDLEEMEVDGGDASDDLLARREEEAHRRLQAVERGAKDPAVAAVLGAYKAGIDDPNEQAAATGLALRTIYNARSKLRALAAAIGQTYDEESES